jgi:uncharacterized membrane protein YkvA (DUF1232 family)
MAGGDAKPDPGEAPAFTQADAERALEPSRALAPYVVKLNASVVKRRFWPKLRRLAVHIPFAEDALAMFYAAFDPATSPKSKAFLLAALAYFVLPTDVIPDWLPGLGFTDDAAVIAAALGVAGRAVLPRHREMARAQIEKIAGLPAAAPAEPRGATA